MANNSIYRYGYFLPTQGIDAAKGRVDLQSIFGPPGEACSIEPRSIGGQNGLYVRSSRELSNEMIARLAGRMHTPLERLRRVETRLATSDPTSVAASAQRASVGASSPAASYQTHAPSISGPARQSTYEQPPLPSPASSHRRESDTGDRRLMAGTPRYMPREPTYPSRGLGASTQSYATSQYHLNDSPERGHEERPSSSGKRPVAQNTQSYAASQYYIGDSSGQGHEEGPSSSGQRPVAQNELSHKEEEEVNPEAAAYDARNDAFFFPPNSVSAEEIQRRRDMLRGTRSVVDRIPSSETRRYW